MCVCVQKEREKEKEEKILIKHQDVNEYFWGAKIMENYIFFLISIF